MWCAIEEKSSRNLKHKRGFPFTAQVLVSKLAPKRTRRDGKKDTDYPRLVGGRFNKQESLQSVPWVAARQVDLHTLLPESQESMEGPELGSAKYPVQMVSATP